MELITLFFDFIVHIDRYLESFVRDHGAWIYVVLFAIVFVETGVVVMPFLPGDSLLFVVGALCGVGLMNYPFSLVLLFAAAVLGDQVNYSIGRYLGPKVFRWEKSRWFNRTAFDTAHAFYERHGGITIIAARFVPFLRTFAPFVAGVAQMQRSQFVFFNVLGAGLWVGGIVTLGYFFGNIAWVQEHMEKVIWALILVPGVFVAWGSWRASRT